MLVQSKKKHMCHMAQQCDIFWSYTCMRKELRAGMSQHTYLFAAIQATDAAIVVQDIVGQSLCDLPK